MEKSYHKQICPEIINEIIKTEIFETVNYTSTDFTPSKEQKAKIFEREKQKFESATARKFVEDCVITFFEATKCQPRNAIKFSNWFKAVYIKKAETTMKEFRDSYDAMFSKDFQTADEKTKQKIISRYKEAFYQQNNVVKTNFNIYRVFKICGKNAYKFSTMQQQFENKNEMEK